MVSDVGCCRLFLCGGGANLFGSNSEELKLVEEIRAGLFHYQVDSHHRLHGDADVLMLFTWLKIRG